jgi:hypothetical protein
MDLPGQPDADADPDADANPDADADADPDSHADAGAGPVVANPHDVALARSRRVPAVPHPSDDDGAEAMIAR